MSTASSSLYNEIQEWLDLAVLKLENMSYCAYATGWTEKRDFSIPLKIPGNIKKETAETRLTIIIHAPNL